MLKMCAAQLREQISTGAMGRHPIWVDLGGGTGNNNNNNNNNNSPLFFYISLRALVAMILFRDD
jgi:hypothetical protein